MPTFTVHPLSVKWRIKAEIGKTTGTAVYLVIADESTTPLAAAGATGLPVLGNLYPGVVSGTLKCVSRDLAPEGDTRIKFIVTCEYDSTISFQPNPLSDDPTYDYGGEESEEPYFKDTQSTPKYARTTAGEPFPELPKRDTSLIVIEMQRNVAASSSYDTYKTYANKINDGGITIDGTSYGDGQVKVGTPKLSAVKTRDAYSFRTLTVTFRIRPEGWDQKYESRGLYELASGVIKPIANTDGSPIETPWPLNTDGTKKSSASAEGAEILLKPYTRQALGGLIA